ncbi:MAG TPA: DUF4112 domain-containing protein [Cyanobacteria bacterium UBA11369]|nr:DUF4112 domain-containing protein [Cyanobacteria bacterium UBA11371]HBE31464.1 DUF4112 domain-containing protein [Cyanobacteria bacterium UBA11368]HBE50956.1 DUF4112 domain-containing protein [Cyanobacteria bacterium UBA11369]
MNQVERIAKLNRIRNFSRWLDSAFRIPGTNFRFGWDPIIGLVPGAGDLVSTALSAYMIYLAARFQLPPKIFLKMLVNLGIEATVGTIPLIGDIFDAFFKANIRNFELLEKHIQAAEPELNQAVPVMPKTETFVR